MKLLIHDDAGRLYTPDYPVTHMGTQSSFSFIPEGNSKTYVIEIPEVTLKYALNNKVTIPVPAEGELEFHKSINLQGFQIDITKVAREKELLTVYVNTNYNVKSPENICNFQLNMDKMSIDYYHWVLNKQLTTEAIEFNIDPKKKNITLYFKELYTIMKGPWTFPITIEN